MNIFKVIIPGLMMVGAAVAAEVQPATTDTMTMQQDLRCRQVLVNCVMNGVPMRMMIDTGATNTVLHTGSLAKLKNPRQMDTSNIQFSGNAKERPSVYLLNVNFADVRVKNHPIMVLNLDGARSMMHEQIDGILGMDLLGAMPFTMDIANGQMHWGLPAGELRLVPLHGTRDAAGRLFMDILCDGRKLNILLDSGSSVTRMPAEAWPAGGAHTVGMSVSDVNEAADISVTVGKPGNVELAPGVSLQNVTPVFCGEGEPIILGMDILSRVRLIHVPSSSYAPGYYFLAL